MSACEESGIRYQYRGNTVPISSARGVNIAATSRGPGWDGVHLEVGFSKGWEGEGTIINGHFLMINLSDEPMALEQKEEGESKWISITRMPGAVFVQPKGHPFSMRQRGSSSWGAAIVDSNFLDLVLGQHHELRGGENIIDGQLSSLFRALIWEITDRERGFSKLTPSLVRSFVLALGLKCGVPATELTHHRGGLAPHQLKMLLTWIQENIENRITVGGMADQIGISAAHFSREFKRSTTMAPREYVMEARLQRASQMLLNGEAAAMTAMKCGFFDQAHLSKLFKSRFGVSPSAVGRQWTGR